MKGFLKKSVVLFLLFTLVFSFSYFLTPQTSFAVNGAPAPVVNTPATTVGTSAVASSAPTPAGAAKNDNWFSKSWSSLGSKFANYGAGVLEASVMWTIQIVLYVLGIIGGTLVAIAGSLFDLALNFSVFQFKALLDNTTSLNTLWALFRDFVNISFIFMLIYIAIKKILSSEGFNEKKLIGALIYDAIFVNFSMLIAKIIIDFGNIFAIAIYNQINGGWGISSVIFNSLGITSLFSEGFSINIAAQTFTILILALKVALVFAATYVFLWAALIFIGRSVMLLYLIIISPIAFSGNAMPALKSEAGNWWKELLHQVFLAPVFLLFMLIVSRIVGAAAGTDITKVLDAASNLQPSALNVSAIFAFLFAIFLMLRALKETKKLSGQVADMAMKIAQGVGAAVAIAVTGGAALNGMAFSALGKGGSDAAKKAKDEGRGLIGQQMARLSFAADKSKTIKFATGGYEKETGVFGAATRFVRGKTISGTKTGTFGAVDLAKIQKDKEKLKQLTETESNVVSQAENRLGKDFEGFEKQSKSINDTQAENIESLSKTEAALEMANRSLEDMLKNPGKYPKEEDAKIMAEAAKAEKARNEAKKNLDQSSQDFNDPDFKRKEARFKKAKAMFVIFA